MSAILIYKLDVLIELFKYNMVLILAKMAQPYKLLRHAFSAPFSLEFVVIAQAILFYGGQAA